MSNIGRVIQDFYCNGYAGRRYDLEGSRIEFEAADYIVLRLSDGEPEFIHFRNGNKQELINAWCADPEVDEDEYAATPVAQFDSFSTPKVGDQVLYRTFDRPPSEDKLRCGILVEDHAPNAYKIRNDRTDTGDWINPKWVEGVVRAPLPGRYLPGQCVAYFSDEGTITYGVVSTQQDNLRQSPLCVDNGSVQRVRSKDIIGLITLINPDE